MSVYILITGSFDDLGLPPGRLESTPVSEGDVSFSAIAWDTNSGASIDVTSVNVNLVSAPPGLTSSPGSNTATLSGDITGLFPPVFIDYRRGSSPVTRSYNWPIPGGSDVTHFSPNLNQEASFSAEVTADTELDSFTKTYTLWVQHDLGLDISNLLNTL